MNAIEIIDRGSGPKLSNSRITVQDVFYYLHRGYGFDFIQQAIPSLTCEEFELVADYAKQHLAELMEKDRRAEEFIRQGVEAQRARGGVFAETSADLTTEERVARLRQKMLQKLGEQNGARHSD